MTEAARRRQELLSQTRRIYNENNSVPAIHPRYGNIYHNLYDNSDINDNPKEFTISGLHIRIICSLLIFILYAAMDIQDISMGKYDSNEIVEAVSQNIVVEKVLDSW